ncbi:Mov34/MPN/PAD-1 family protein [Psychrobacillus sp. FSL H8-0484]|uniref:Mov34/MPN/PAD-1 family protein n=1 Tax=Psychrobacillus sp. FSL H8-0484 TaxID=2921390 RepID=UPI0030F659E2
MEELTLWDLGLEKVEEKKEEKKETTSPKTKTTTSSSKPAGKETPTAAPTPPKEPIKVTDDWTIHFGAEKFKVTDFVEEVPEEGVTLDEIRAEMEKHFAQFSAARTKWDVDKENKRLFPDSFAGSKGGVSPLRAPYFLSIDELQAYDGNFAYIVGQDAQVYEMRKSIFGEMLTKAEHLADKPVLKPNFTFTLPKIPKELIAQILAFFCAYTKKGRFEVMNRIYWDLETKSYLVECPKQVVTHTHIDATYNESYIGRNSIRYLPVVEIHSHNTMPAFFSEIDDRDEKRFGIYAVVGKLDTPKLEIIVRAKANDAQVNVPVTEIFELPASLNGGCSYPPEWDNLVELKG